VNYWKVANSWNPYWGEKGYFRIKFGAAGIDDAVTASPNDAKWSNKGEVAAASSAHPDRLAQIKQIQSTESLLWKPALVDRFASEAPGASKSLCGVKGDWKADIEAAIKNGKVKKFVPAQGLAAIKVPESFDSETNWPQCAKVIGDIRDQSNCGCCWAFAGAEAASDRMCIATNASIMVPLSAQDVCFCGSDDGCDGGQIDAPWMYISEVGAVSGGQYQGTGPFGKGMCSDFSLPHCHHHGPQGKDPYPAEGAPGCPSAKSPTCPSKCDAGAANDHKDFESDKYTFTGEMVSASGVADVQQLIMAGGPVETAFTVFSDFENYAGGIYHPTTTDSVGGHAVRIVGWGAENGVNYWKVANSWNPYWGEKGYFRIKFGAAGIDDSVTASPNDAKWSKKSTEVIV
jgi:cathepsin B